MPEYIVKPTRDKPFKRVECPILQAYLAGFFEGYQMDSEFGDIVKTERVARGWTIRDMCDKLGKFGSGTYTPPYICYIESSKKLPSVDLVLKYTQVMGFPEGYLWEIAKKELIENYKQRLEKSWARKLKT